MTSGDETVRQRAWYVVEAALVVAVIAFAFLVIVRTGQVLFAGDPSAPMAMISGFFGAFFAFIFVRFADFFTRLYERSVRNRNALVAIQHRYLQAINEISDNVHSLQVWDRIRAGGVALWMSRLHDVPMPRDLLLQLTNIDLVNELFDLHTRIHRINQDSATFNRTYEELSAAMLDGKIPQADYVANLQGLDQHRWLMQEFMTAAEVDMQRAVAALRVAMSHRTIGQRLQSALLSSRYTDGFKRARETEERAVQAEAAELGAGHRRRIEELEAAAEARRLAAGGGPA
jgi:hypothetical protein